MDLSTRYLGLELPHPLMPGASPLADSLDTVRRLEDAGASAIVLRSLYEEQIIQDRQALLRLTDEPAESFAEALSYFPRHDEFVFGPDSYLEQLRRIKQMVAVPVIASLNGVTPSGWIDNARMIQQAGADALEINIYRVAANPGDTGASVEDDVVGIATMVKAAVTIPVAVKLSPFFSALPHLVRRLENVGVDGLVLFNRFYQPDIDIEALEVRPTLQLSTSAELRLRLRWLAILSERVAPSLAVSGGVHTVDDVIKAVMTGAHAVQLVSALLQHGPAYLAILLKDLTEWLEWHEYKSLRQMQGSMNLHRSPSPASYERAQYLRILQSWRPEDLPQ